METCHILVVEDDQDINRLLCRILTDGGYDVRPAFSGSEAVLWAEPSAPEGARSAAS